MEQISDRRIRISKTKIETCILRLLDCDAEGSFEKITPYADWVVTPLLRWRDGKMFWAME